MVIEIFISWFISRSFLFPVTIKSFLKIENSFHSPNVQKIRGGGRSGIVMVDVWPVTVLLFVYSNSKN